jgi:hypothetical protein
MYRFAILLLFVHLLLPVTASAAENGTMSGQLKLQSGEPLTGGVVMFFNVASGPPPAPDRYWRVADTKAPIDDKGNFMASLPAGTYYLGVAKRTSGSITGPPQDGDYYLPSPDANGVYKTYAVKPGQNSPIGAIAEARVFKAAEHRPTGPVTSIDGTVFDEKGLAVENALVFVFNSPQMGGRPLFVSDKTAKDGSFSVRLHQGGTYYLRIRHVYGGGVPKQNEIMGGYGTREVPTPVKVDTGKSVKGIEIRGVHYTGRGLRAKPR